MSWVPFGTFAQSNAIQNPFWVIPRDPSGFMKGFHASPSLELFSPQPVLPVPTWCSYPPEDRLHTAANGIFDACGNARFFVLGDGLYNAQHQLVTYFELKDYWIKCGKPGMFSYPFQENNNPLPWTTDNFEALLVPVPAHPDEYFYFFTDSKALSGSLCPLYVGRYNVTTQSYSGSKQRGDYDSTVYAASSVHGIRLAASQPYPNGSRRVYVVDANNWLVWFPLPASGASPVFGSEIPLLSPSGGGFPGPELELSHDGRGLAWATYYPGSGSTIHLYDTLLTEKDTIRLPKNAMNRVSGLEYLPDGRLAAAIEWNAPLTAFNGVCIIDTSLNSIYHVPGSASYRYSQIELGYGTTATALLWASNGSVISGINPTTAQFEPGKQANIQLPPHISTNPIYDYFSPSGFPLLYWQLPDQIDGAHYGNVALCLEDPIEPDPGGGGNPESQAGRASAHFDAGRGQILLQGLPTATEARLIAEDGRELFSEQLLPDESGEARFTAPGAGQYWLALPHQLLMISIP